MILEPKNSKIKKIDTKIEKESILKSNQNQKYIEPYKTVLNFDSILF